MSHLIEQQEEGTPRAPSRSAATRNELEQTHGATFIREVTIQYRGARIKACDPITDPARAVDVGRKIVKDDAREHFLALYLDGRHRPIAYSVVSVGTASASLVHPREVFQRAVLVGASALLVLHNHPSGDRTPSREDLDVTRRLARAGELLGIRLLDHIVWTRHGAFHSAAHTSPEQLKP